MANANHILSCLASTAKLSGVSNEHGPSNWPPSFGSCRGNGPTEASTVQVPSLPHQFCGTGELQEITTLQLPHKETQKIVCLLREHRRYLALRKCWLPFCSGAITFS